MSTHAKATFDIKSWDESTYEEIDGKKLNKASTSYTYQGDIVGESRGEMILVYPTETTSTYAGLERIIGTLGGKKGSFVMQGSGEYDGKVSRMAYTIVPSTGTGELAGIRGTAKMEA